MAFFGLIQSRPTRQAAVKEVDIPNTEHELLESPSFQIE